MSLKYRVFLEDRAKKSNMFETTVISHNLASTKGWVRDGSESPVDNEVRAKEEFRLIRKHRRFRMEVDSEDGYYVVHTLLAALQQTWTLPMIIELIRNTAGGPKIGTTVIALKIGVQITGYVVLGSATYAFNFKLVGSAEEETFEE